MKLSIVKIKIIKLLQDGHSLNEYHRLKEANIDGYKVGYGVLLWLYKNEFIESLQTGNPNMNTWIASEKGQSLTL